MPYDITTVEWLTSPITLGVVGMAENIIKRLGLIIACTNSVIEILPNLYAIFGMVR